MWVWGILLFLFVMYLIGKGQEKDEQAKAHQTYKKDEQAQAKVPQTYKFEDDMTVSYDDFCKQSRNSVKFDNLYAGKYVTVTGCKISEVKAEGNGYKLTAYSPRGGIFYFIFTAANAEQIVDLDEGDVVTIRGIGQKDGYGNPVLVNCSLR